MKRLGTERTDMDDMKKALKVSARRLRKDRIKELHREIDGWLNELELERESNGESHRAGQLLKRIGRLEGELSPLEHAEERDNERELLGM